MIYMKGGIEESGKEMINLDSPDEEIKRLR